MPLVKLSPATERSAAGTPATLDPTPWHTLAEDDGLPGDGAVLVPLARWPALRDTLLKRNSPFGILLSSSESPDAALLADLAVIPVIALDFPVFGDGRAYSTATILRRNGFAGELRAVGDALLDQLPLMARVGFTAFDVRNTSDLAAMETVLNRHDAVYQATVDGRPTVWQRRHELAAGLATGPASTPAGSN